MSWRHRIAIVVLTVLAGLPVAGTACALVCDPLLSVAVAPTHHGSSRTCSEPVRPPADTQVRGVADHECGLGDMGVWRVATVAAERADTGATAAPSISCTSVALPAFEPPRAAGVVAHSTAPPLPASPRTTPLVLRV